MEFISFAVLGAIVGAVSASSYLHKAHGIEGNIQNRLLKKATRVGASRRLEQDGAGAENDSDEAGITFGKYPLAYKIQFQTCLALPASSDQASEIFQFNDYMTTMEASGAIGTQKSFVLFDVCPVNVFGNPFDGNKWKGKTLSSSSSCKNVDLATYIDVVSTRDHDAEGEGLRSYQDAYCEACAASSDFCQAGSVSKVLALENYQIDAQYLPYFDLSLLTGNTDDTNYIYGDGEGDAENSNYNHTKITTSEGQLLGVETKEASRSW